METLRYGFGIASCVDSFSEEDIDNCLIRINSKFYISEYIEGDKKEQEIYLGCLDSIYLDYANAINKGYDIDDVFDIDEGIADLASIIYDDKSFSFKEEIEEQFSDGLLTSLNIFFLEKMELLPGCTAPNFEVAAILRVIQQFAHGTALILVEPFPFLSLGTPSKATVIQSWEMMGFKQIGNSKYWALDPSVVNPKLDDFTNFS